MKRLTGINPHAWEHPADKAALNTVKQIKGLDELIKALVSVTTERSIKLMVLASCVKVTEYQYSKLDTILNDVIEVFGSAYKPPLFITQNPFWNASVLGVKEPIIILNNAMLRTGSDEEICAVLGHELGHIMSGHTLYKTLVYLLANISLNVIPFSQVLLLPIRAALFEWDRKSELTADRAGLLAVQNPQDNYNLLMKMAGADDLTQVNSNEFFKQAHEYEMQQTVLDTVHKFLNQLWESHPFPVIRLQELKTWESSGAYQKILNGDYATVASTYENAANTRTAAESQDVKADIKGAYEYYRETVRQGTDPVSTVLNKAATGVESAVGNLGDKLKDVFGTKGNGNPEENLSDKLKGLFGTKDSKGSD
ncbi:M48 family metallopeptidase [Breznakiellaceae bacterium SP9]